MRHPDGRIRRDGVERGLGHDHGGRGEGQAPNAEADRGRRDHDDRLRPPGAVRIVDFGGGQRDPADVDVTVDPGDPARIPRHAEQRPGGHRHGGHRGRPIPSAIDHHPVAIVVGHVAKRFLRHPGLVPVPLRPPAHRKRLPGGGHRRGPPELVVFALVVDPFPPAVFFQRVGIIVQLGRHVSDRRALSLDALCPQAVAPGVPVIPGRIQGPVAGGDLRRVGKDGAAARNDGVSGVRGRVDERDVTFQGDHFHRLIAHIEVEGGMGLGQDRAEGRGRLDYPVGAVVREPCDPRGEVDV